MLPSICTKLHFFLIGSNKYPPRRQSPSSRNRSRREPDEEQQASSSRNKARKEPDEVQPASSSRNKAKHEPDEEEPEQKTQRIIPKLTSEDVDDEVSRDEYVVQSCLPRITNSVSVSFAFLPHTYPTSQHILKDSRKSCFYLDIASLATINVYKH